MLRTAPQAASVNATFSHFGPGRVRPEWFLPPDTCSPGHTPAQEARCAAVGKTLMSTPISASITCATFGPTSGIVCISS